MRLLVCGSRSWADVDRVAEEIARLAPSVVIHGAAPGADSIAGGAAQRMGYVVEPFPADWKRDGKAAGSIRNERMLRQGEPDGGLAFGGLWKRDTFSRSILWRHTGTGDMVAKMLRAGLPVDWVEERGAATKSLPPMPGWPRAR